MFELQYAIIHSVVSFTLGSGIAEEYFEFVIAKKLAKCKKCQYHFIIPKWLMCFVFIFSWQVTQRNYGMITRQHVQHRKPGEPNQRSSRDMVTHGRPERTLGVLLPLVVSTLQYSSVGQTVHLGDTSSVEFQIIIVCILLVRNLGPVLHVTHF